MTPLHPPTALLVEDNAAIRTLQRFVLTRAGLRVTECADLNAAEQALAQDTPDVLVLDLNLPDGHGLTLLSRINRARTAVLVMTGMSQPHTLTEGAERADDVMTKPFEPDVFAARVTALARRDQPTPPAVQVPPSVPRRLHAAHPHQLLLNFGLLSLTVSFALTVLIVLTGATLITERLQPGRFSIWPVLIGTCAAAGLSCAVLSGTQFMQRSVQARANRDADTRARLWNEALLAWAYHDQPLPETLDLTGAQVLLKLRDTLRGDVSDRLARLYDEQGWLNTDLRTLASKRTSVTLRAEIIERLALLRDSRALDALDTQLRHPHRDIRALALLALSRSVGRLDLRRPERTVRVLALHGAISGGQFSTGQVQETLTLLGDAGLPLSRELLLTAPDTLKNAALDVLARQRVRSLDVTVTTLLGNDNPELRAGALRVLTSSGTLNPDLHSRVLTLTEDDVPFVRVQATRAAALIDPLPCARLWTLLGDTHWWVRRAAAQGLLRAPGGQVLLRQAATRHSDRYARDAALGALQEHEERHMPLHPTRAQARP